MKLLEKLTIEMLEDKTRAEIESLLLRELESKDDTALKSQIISLREERIRKQKRLIAKQMEEEISRQLKLIGIIQDSQTATEEKDKAYYEILDFLHKKDEIYSESFLLESYYVLEYAIKKREIEAIDFLMKKRTKMYRELIDTSKVFGLYHAKPMLQLLKLDAKQGRDEEAKEHIESAVKGEYDVLEFQDGACFYSYTTKAYQELYEKYKTKQELEIF